MALELTGEPVRHRHRPTRAPALRLGEVARACSSRRTRTSPASQSTSRQRSATSSPCRSPVIAAANHSTRSSSPRRSSPARPEQGLELLAIEEADVGVGSALPRPIDRRHWVGPRPAPAHRVGEDPVQERQVVVDRLPREPLARLRRHVGLDQVRLDRRPPPCRRRTAQVAADDRAVVAHRRLAPPAHHLDVANVALGRGREREPLGPAAGRRGARRRARAAARSAWRWVSPSSCPARDAVRACA